MTAARRGASGGRPGAAGYRYQGWYVALHLAKLLAGAGERPLHEVIWEKKALHLEGHERTLPLAVNDVAVLRGNGDLVLVEVKAGKPASSWTNCALFNEGIMTVFWDQWSNLPASLQESSWQPEEAQIICLGSSTRPGASATHRSSAAEHSPRSSNQLIDSHERGGTLSRYAADGPHERISRPSSAGSPVPVSSPARPASHAQRDQRSRCGRPGAPRSRRRRVRRYRISGCDKGIRHGPATYLFAESPAHEPKTLLAVGRPRPPDAQRDTAYQRGYPLADTYAGRPVDRGHFLPYSGGGLYGPNLYIQDRALNRGWSREGRQYRRLERLAVSSSNALMWVRPIYIDESAVPAELDLGVALSDRSEIDTFRNRFDERAVDGQDALLITLAGATTSQIGALGEETAAVLLESRHDALIIHMGDAGLERENGCQHLDLIVAIDDVFIAYEVKTRYVSERAGRVTRAGNLVRPRLRRAATEGHHRQGSQGYVAARLGGWADLTEDFPGIELRVMAVDLVALLAQQFCVNDAGTRLTALGIPESCGEEARTALARIIEHRGYL